jgi:hypothetical protein
MAGRSIKQDEQVLLVTGQRRAQRRRGQDSPGICFQV